MTNLGEQELSEFNKQGNENQRRKLEQHIDYEDMNVKCLKLKEKIAKLQVQTKSAQEEETFLMAEIEQLQHSIKICQLKNQNFKRENLQTNKLTGEKQDNQVIIEGIYKQSIHQKQRRTVQKNQKELNQQSKSSQKSNNKVNINQLITHILQLKKTITTQLLNTLNPNDHN